ncbi:MAG: hypothetical protein KKD44_26475, partial [Proteobacteria bacterium]|nr:hypothetical protein [Pseudomonadota bacterium]
HKEGYIQHNPVSSLEQKVQKSIKTKKTKQVVEPEPKLTHIASRPDRRQMYFNLSLIAFVIVSTFMISIVRLSAMVIEQADMLAIQAEVQILDPEGQVLGVETEGGSIVTLARVLDSNFNLSVNGYVEGSVLHSTSGSDAPLVVANTIKVENLNADLLDGKDWTDLPDLITEASPDMWDFSEFKDNMTLDANTNIALGSLVLSTSGSGALDFNSTGQVSFAGNVDAENGLDVTGNITSSGDLTVSGGDITLGTTSIFSGGDTASLNNIDSIDSTTEGTFESALDFLRSDTSDSYTSGALSFSDGTFLDLSAIIHNDTALQGIRLPQNTSFISPTSGEGFVAWDIDDDKIQVFDGSTWVDVGGSGSSAFADITSGTNVSAAMVVGTGASLTYSGTGTINASSLESLTASQFLRSDASDNYTSGTLTLDAGTTLEVNGDLSVADTNIAFNGTSTTFTTTGDLTINSGGGDLILSDTVSINIGGSGSDVLYNVIGDSTTGASANVDSDDDLYIEGNLEVDGTIYGNVSGTINPGFTTGSVIFQGASGLAEDNPNFFWDDTNNKLGVGTNSPTSRLHVATNTTTLTGKSAFIVDQWETEDILTASASGSTKMTLTNDGTLQLYNASSTISNTSGDITIDAASDNISFSGDNLINIGQIDASDQVRVGNLASNPTAIGEGSIYYNTTDDSLYYYTAAGWAAVGSGGGSGSSWWAEALGVLSPINETVDLAIGGTATASATFYVSAASGDLTFANSETLSNAVDSELALSDGTNTLTIDLDEDTATAIDFTTNGSVDLTFNPGGNVGIGTTSPSDPFHVVGSARFQESGDVDNYGQVYTASDYLYFTSYGTAADSGGMKFLVNDAGTEALTILANGNVGIAGVLNAGSTTTTTYSRFGTGTTNHGLSAANDVLISDGLEINGALYPDSGIYSSDTGTLTLSFTGDDAILVGDLTLTAGGVIQSTADNNITIDAGAGTVIIGDGTGKLNAGTVDPVYNVGGEKFATYMAGMVGVKEETAGIIETNQYVPGVGYKHTIDFTNQERGSDLWLFSKATDIDKHIDNLIVLLSPSGNARSWYEVDIDNYTLSIYTSRPTSVSYRLTAPRFDAADWSNYNNDPGTFGFVVDDDELIGTGDINQEIPSLSDYEVFAENTEYKIRTISGEIIEGIEAFAGLAVANIKAGAIEVTDLTVKSSAYIANTLRAGAIETASITTDTFLAFQGTVDNLLITSGLVSPIINTETISPIADSDLIIDLDNSAPSATDPSFGKLVVKGVDEQEVASIDAEGNATFSGTLESEKVKTKELVADRIYVDEIISKSSPSEESPITIEQIEELLRQSQEDQELLADVTDSNIFTATDSASLDELVLGQLYVTGQAAINTLSVSTSFTVGSDFVAQSFIGEDGTIINSLDTLSAPLKLQSLAMAPLEIMAGKVIIDT